MISILGDCKGCKERRDKVNEFSRQLTERLGAWIRNPVGPPPSFNQPPPPEKDKTEK